MLQLKVSRTAINETGEEMYLADVTGNYNDPDNLGGWGAPNPDRTSKALVAEAFLNKSDDAGGKKDVALDPYDPETVSNFLLHTDEDGYYEFIMVAVDKVEPTIEGTYGWTASTQLVKLEDGVLVRAYPSELLADENFLDAVSFKTLLIARMNIERNRRNLKLVELMMANYDDGAHNREIADAQEEFDFINVLTEGAYYQWCIDGYTAAQLIVEGFENYINE